MTVTGATTAQVATVSYTPPYKYVTSYPPAVQVTGTVTGPINNNPTSGFQDGSLGNYQYTWAYLQAHMMSDPSYRYAYLLWIVFALIAGLYILAHHVRLGRLSFAAGLSRWSMRRHTIGSKKPGRRNRALPSNGTMVFAALIGIASICLGVIGADYIAPNVSVFNLAKRAAIYARSSPTAPKVTVQKSLWTLGSRLGFIAFALMPLVVLLALKSPPVAFLSLRPLAHMFSDKLAILHRAVAWLIWGVTTAHVVLWTIQLFEDSYKGIPTWVYLWANYRFIFGSVAYLALTALMVLSTRPIRKHRYEFFYIAHVTLVFITIVACAVHHPVLWYWMVAAGALWLAERVLRYLRFARINRLWGGKGSRVTVSGRQYDDIAPADPYTGEVDAKPPADFGYHNPYNTEKTLPKFPTSRSAPMALTGGQPDFSQPSDLPYYDEQAIKPLDRTSGHFADPYGDSSRPPSQMGSRPGSSYMPDPYERSRPGSTTATLVGIDMQKQPSTSQTMSSLARAPVLDDPKPPPIPVGYAQAQLLPSRTMRLTVHAPHPFKWAPGQSCLLYLPDLSKIQSHPFTIINNSDSHESEIVILVKARKGITRRLYDLVRARSLQAVGVTAPTNRRISLASVRAGGEAGMKVPPVHVRAWVDGPFGSAARVHWNEFSTVTIICGGSGVSFGAAVCDYVCRLMSNRLGRNFKTRRVRFCWVARQYAEIAWVAGVLYRCTQMVSQDQLQISIFVTHAAGADRPPEDFSAPRPGFMGHSRRDSNESVSSEMSIDGVVSPTDPAELGLDSGSYTDVIDLTNYDDEEDVNDPAEMQFSDRLQHQGKVRRAKTRKAMRRGQARQSRNVTSPTHSAYPPTRRSQLAYDDDTADAEKQYALAASGATQAMLSPDTAARPSGEMPRSISYGPSNAYSAQDLGVNNGARPHTFAHYRNQSSRSVSDSVYDRYDPYNPNGNGMGGGGSGMYGRGSGVNSPAPSIFGMDDNQSVAGESMRHLVPRTPRTGSMVLLESDAGDPSADAGLWIDQADYLALNVMTEMARPGKPKLATVLEEEINRAEGRMIVATCGPITLNTVVRNLVGRHISPSRIRHGDNRGHIAIYSEDYES